MHLQIGHGHEERHRKESYCSFYPQEVLKFCSSPVRKKNNKNMNKMAQNRKLQFFTKVLYQVLLTSSLLVDQNFFQINFQGFFEVGKL